MTARRSITTIVLACLLLVTAGIQVVTALSWGHGSWQLSEWLINYQGGFVRRGLAGEMFRHVSTWTGIRANLLAIVFSYGVFVVFCAALIRHAKGRFAVPFLISCVVLGFPAYQDCIVRKDCLLLLLFLVCVRLMTLPQRFWWSDAVVALLSCCAVLCHETYAFFAFPGLVLFSVSGRTNPIRHSSVRQALVLTPAAICLLLAVLNHGDPATAERVNDSWIPLWQITNPGDPAIQHPTAAIEGLGWTTRQGLYLSWFMLTSGFYQPMAWLMVFCLAFILTILFTPAAGQRHTPVASPRLEAVAMLVCQLLFISPLFLLGVDYGRWLFFWVASSMIFIAAGFSAPIPVLHILGGLWRGLDIERRLACVPVRDEYLLLFGVPVCWTLYNFLTASPLGRIISLLWSWLN